MGQQMRSNYQAGYWAVSLIFLCFFAIGQISCKPKPVNSADEDADEDHIVSTKPGKPATNFISRPAKRVKYGGKTTDDTQRLAFQWLAKNQKRNGSWIKNPGKPDYSFRVGVTALALNAFLHDGHTESSSRFSKNIRKAVDWLLNDVDPTTGKFKSAANMQEQAWGALALNEAYAMGIKRVREKADLATKFIVASQAPSGGWRDSFSEKTNEGVSFAATGLQILALKQARDRKYEDKLRAEVENSLMKARRWVISANGGEDGTGFVDPQSVTLEATAIGALVRIYSHSTKQDEQLRKAMEVLIANLPEQNSKSKRDEFLYCYFGTQVCFKWQGEEWKTWRNAIMKLIYSSQNRKKGRFYGSWAPIGEYGQQIGRTGQTALACICLETYYIY